MRKCTPISKWAHVNGAYTIKIIFSFIFQHVGCDNIVGSTASKDQCGVCKGDNSSCSVFEGQFKEQPRRNSMHSPY